MDTKTKIAPYTPLNVNRLESITNIIANILSGFPDTARPTNEFGKDVFYHYTSIDKLFKILDGDSLWASRSSFSNDSTEGKMLGEEWIKENQYYGDNYIVCFCDKNDILSQWRGYCPKGGVSIGFKFIKESIYTICLNNTNDKPLSSGKNVDLYINSPLPVIYCQTANSLTRDKGINVQEDLFNLWDTINEESAGISMQDIVPYLKSDFFRDEREYRLVFDNTKGELDDYIQFRELKDGTQLPYIVVKSGNLLNCGHNLKRTYTKDRIDEIFSEHIKSRQREPIVIPNGVDQKAVCRAFTEHIKNHKKDMLNNTTLRTRWDNNPLMLLCDGHLPIVSITISPSPNQEYIKEVVERFCRSRYWLQNVEVNCSRIPYIYPTI